MNFSNEETFDSKSGSGRWPPGVTYENEHARLPRLETENFYNFRVPFFILIL